MMTVSCYIPYTQSESLVDSTEASYCMYHCEIQESSEARTKEEARQRHYYFLLFPRPREISNQRERRVSLHVISFLDNKQQHIHQ